MRKTRNSVESILVDIVGTGTATPHLEWGPFSFETSRESIDTHSGRSDRSRFRPCTHTRYSGEFNHSSYTWGVTPTWSYTADSAAGVFRQVHGSIERDQSCEGWPPVSHFDWDAAAFRAFEAMRPSLSTPLNMTVFLAELRDIQRLWEVFDYRSGFVKKLKQQWQELRRKPAKTLASDHLTLEFGWKQLYRDLHGLISQTLDFSERLDEFLSRENAVQLRHYSEDPGLPTTYQWEGHLYPLSPDPDHIRTINIIDSGYYATMEYDYALPSYSHRETWARAFLDAYGLNLNLSTLWELIPFSFVVDWFVGIGKFLESFEDSWLDPILRIRQFCHTLVYEYQANTQCRLRTSPWVVVATNQSRCYYRKLGVPPTLGAPYAGGGWSGKRVALATSLWTSRRK